MAISTFSRPRPQASSAGAYFAVLASGFAALVLLLLIFDQLGAPAGRITFTLAAFPAVIFVAIGAATFTSSMASWQTCDRICPPSLGAASSLAAVFGCIGFVALPGAFFFLGFDALPFTTGIVLGLLLHAVLIAPYARKDGAFTLAGYLGRRFESPLLRFCAAVALTLPCLLLMIGEFKVIGFLLGHVLQQNPADVVAVLGAIAAGAIALSGMRGAVWGGAAGGLLVLMVLLLLPALAGLMVINVPVPQIAYGLARTEMARLELAAGMDTHAAAAMVLTLPGAAPAALVKPFLQPFVANDPVSFTLLTITVALGIASLPVLFARAGTSPSVATSRRMSVWLMCCAGAVAVTLPAVAFLTRLALLHALPSSGSGEVPAWLESLGRLGLADFDRDAASVPLAAVHFTRDSANLLLPLALGLPRPLVDVMLASAVAAALAAISAEAMALAAMWGEDIAFVWSAAGQREPLRLNAGRLLAVLAVAAGAWLSLRVRADALTLFTWAMALAGSSVFTLLVMSVWWKRINQWGALAGLLAGTLAALAQILLSLNGALPLMFGVSGALASIMAAPLSAAVALGVSLTTPPPGSSQIDLVRDIRVAGGETILDREIRLAKLNQPPAS